MECEMPIRQREELTRKLRRKRTEHKKETRNPLSATGSRKGEEPADGEQTPKGKNLALEVGRKTQKTTRGGGDFGLLAQD